MTKYMWLSIILFVVGILLLIIGIVTRKNLNILVGILAMAGGTLAFFTRRNKPAPPPNDNDIVK